MKILKWTYFNEETPSRVEDLEYALLLLTYIFLRGNKVVTALDLDVRSTILVPDDLQVASACKGLVYIN